MEKFENTDDALDFAIEQEIAAQNFYNDLAAKSAIPEMKRVFESFVFEEKGHQAKLQAIEGDRSFTATQPTAVQDLKLADYLVEVEPTPEMEYKDALVLAMKKEKAAYRLYIDLAGIADSTEMKDTFLFLANEEAKHKLRFEVEYDDIILQED